MKIESQLLEDHQVKLKVEIEPEPLEDAKRRAARAIARRAKIPGFRPGKAPYHIVERYAGPDTILADAMDLLIKDLYPQIIEQSGIKPYGPGKLENIPTTTPPTFEFVVPLEAEVEPGDYRAIRKPYEPKTVTEEDVDRVLENMRQQQAVIEPVERPAQEGDLVTIKLGALRKEVEEGEDPTLIRERSMPVIVQAEGTGEEGEEAAAEWPFPGFSRSLAGLSVGDERTLTYTFPEDSSFEALRGKEAEYHFVVESVKSRTLPEINDELAHTQGEYENLDALRNEIRTRLGEQMQGQYEDEYNESIIDELVEQATIKFPPPMVEEEIHTLLHQLENRLARQNMDLETYRKTRQMTQAELEEELTPTAESRLKRFLALYEVARIEDIEVSPEEVQSEASRTIEALSRSLSPEEARKGFSNEFVESLMRNIMADQLIRHTMERLRTIAKGEWVEQAQPEPAQPGTEPEGETETGPSQAETVAETSPSAETGEEQPAGAGEPEPTQPAAGQDAGQESGGEAPVEQRDGELSPASDSQPAGPSETRPEGTATQENME